MSNYQGKLRLRVDNKKLSFDLLKSVAKDIYEHVRSKQRFPYDADQKRSEDKRKIWGSPWHLRSMGAAFVGSDKVAGHYYKGDAKSGNKNIVTIVFTNIKEVGKKAKVFDIIGGKKAFDYAGKVLPEGTSRSDWSEYITSADIDRFIDKAVDEYWDKL